MAFAAPAFDNRRMGGFERRWRARSRRHWAILIACLALGVTGVWLALGDRAGPGVVVLPSGASRTPSPPAEAAIEPAIERAAPVALGSRGSERVEVCGLGWVDADADGNADPARLARMPALQAARGRLLESLASSADGFERAASLWLRTFDPASTTLAGDAREQLARTATTTSDPRIYAMAFKTCAKPLAAASCALLNARRWAQLDGDNGEPWIFLLDEASTRKDRQQAEEALFHIAAAARVADRIFAVPGVLAVRPATSDAMRLAANSLAVDALGLASAEALPLQAVAGACRGPALADANRRQRCEAIATALVDRSDTLLLAAVGVTLGRGLGWPQARLDTVAALAIASRESLPREAALLPWVSCSGVEAFLGRLARQSVVGEDRYAREWIQARGMTVERYAAQQAELRRRPAETLAREANTALLAGAPRDAETAASVPAR